VPSGREAERLPAGVSGETGDAVHSKALASATRQDRKESRGEAVAAQLDALYTVVFSRILERYLRQSGPS